MTDYVKATDFALKDNLPTGDPGKLAKGSEVDAEFVSIQTHTATKYDSSFLASKLAAQDGSSETGLMTPQRTTDRIAALIASVEQAKAGTSDTNLMTPLQTDNVLDNLGLKAEQDPTFGAITAASVTATGTSTLDSVDVTNALTASTVTGGVVAATTAFVGGIITALEGSSYLTEEAGLVIGGHVTITDDDEGIKSTAPNNKFNRLIITGGEPVSFIIRADSEGDPKDWMRFQDSGAENAVRLRYKSPADSSDVVLLDGQGQPIYTIDNTEGSFVPGGATLSFAHPPVSKGIVLAGYGSIGGMITSMHAGAADDRVVVSAGGCSDSTNTRYMVGDGLKSKYFDQAWAQGNGSGGFPSGAIRSVNTWYRFFAIMKENGTVDYGWDEADETDATNLLTDANANDYLYYRQIGWHLSSADSSTFVRYFQTGDRFTWRTPISDVWNTSINVTGGVAGEIGISAPPDESAIAHIDASVYSDLEAYVTSAGIVYIIYTDDRQPESIPPDSDNYTLRFVQTDNQDQGLFDVRNGQSSHQLNLNMHTSGKIRARVSSGTQNWTHSLSTQGFTYCRRDNI